MSRSLIDRSHDLRRLRDEGYKIETTAGGHLLIKEVPYVTHEIEIARGVLVSQLELRMGPEGEMTKQPSNHVALFIGKKPCDQEGNPLNSLVIGDNKREIEAGLTVNFDLSRKVWNEDRYQDYYHKMRTYFNYLGQYVQNANKNIAATTHTDEVS